MAIIFKFVTVLSHIGRLEVYTRHLFITGLKRGKLSSIFFPLYKNEIPYYLQLSPVCFNFERRKPTLSVCN